MNQLSDIYKYYKERIVEVKQLATSGPGDLWAFLMSCCFIDFLVKMVYNKESSSTEYKNFIKDYLYLINPLYRDFQYANGKKDLPEQMYHILRCGMIHSYSLVPDRMSLKNNGRVRSILLGQKRHNEQHFTPIIKNGFDAVLFTVEDFVGDLEKVLDKIFIDLAPNNPSLEKNIVQWINKFPPIMQLNI